MSYRDPLIAARARTEGLEEQLSALEAENQQLRRDLGLLETRSESEAPPTRWRSYRVALRVGIGLALTVVLYAVGGRLLTLLMMLLGGLATTCWLVWSSFVRVVPPGEIAIVSGRAHRQADGSLVGYRIVEAGRLTLIPVVEAVDFLSVRPFQITVNVLPLYCIGGQVVDISLRATVNVHGTPPLVGHAIERFLGRPTQEVVRVASETLEGVLRDVGASHDRPSIEKEPASFTSQVLQAAHVDFEKLGLAIGQVELLHVKAAVGEV